ncbi:MAG: histone deacetylase family protein, partial [Alphaproteobacteria bacterium]
VAVGALRAHQEHGCARVAVIDFDVHHGNGTQAMFAADPRLFYASTHQWPLYPGTGARSERGVAGNVVNAPLPANAGSADFRFVVAEHVLPALEDFRPDFVFISAGFDGHSRDPLAALNLFEDDYAWVTDKLTELAARHCGGRVVSVLEGGYDLEALADSAAAHVGALMRA